VAHNAGVNPDFGGSIGMRM